MKIASLGKAAQLQVKSQMGAFPKRNKYGAVKTAYTSTQGFTRTYDSKREAAYAAELDARLAQRGVLLWWLPQVPIPLPGGYTYRVDFMLGHGGFPPRFIDTKGMETPVSKMKRALVKHHYGIDVEVVK